MNVEETVRDYIAKNLMPKHANAQLGLDDQLLEGGIVNSFGIVELVSYLEKTFGIEVSDYDVVPENFQTVRDITRLVEQKRK